MMNNPTKLDPTICPQRQTAELLQVFANHSVLEVTQYEAICNFLEEPCYAKLIKTINTIDVEVDLSKQMSISQIECVKYLIRDWGYQHLKPHISRKEKGSIFKINNKVQASGHFIKAIDFAKRNPKDNRNVLQFALTLLIHSALPEETTKPKIEALEQLLSSIHRVNPTQGYAIHSYRISLNSLICLNLALLGLCLIQYKLI